MTEELPMDRVEINGLRVTTVIGVLPHERKVAQPVRIDLSLVVDLRDAGLSDDLGDTVDYGAIIGAVADLARASRDGLVERLAQRIAHATLAFERVEAVDVTLTKLRLPVCEDVDSAAVRVHRTRDAAKELARAPHRAIVALGTNVGDRAGHLRRAIEQLGVVVAQSQVFETDPVGGPEGQGPYLNMVVVIATPLDPFALLRRLRRIEAQAGRTRAVRWGPRTLDLDLLFHDDVVLTSEELTLPHPRVAERRFVLAPLSEVAPERCPAGWDAALPPGGVHARGPLEALQ